nr:heme o synthase [Tomitella biformata]
MGLLGRVGKTAGAYLALTKPRVIELLLVATIPAMLLANRTLADPKSAGALALLVLSTLFGGWLGAASANTLNCVIDADIDKVMKRTLNRPLVSDAVSTKQALIFGLVTGVASFLWLSLMVNWLSGILIVITIAFYVLVYTKLLKRRTSQNVVWGGAAGCMPVMIGWSAVTGTIGWPAVVMFLIIFFWTPPHTWALGMKYRDDYKAAGVPMLPVVAEPQVVTHRIVLYTIAMVVTSFALIPATGLIYAISSVLIGAWFLTMAIRLHIGVRNGAEVKPLKLFIMSNNYLAALFLALALDSVLNMTTVADLL